MRRVGAASGRALGGDVGGRNAATWRAGAMFKAWVMFTFNVVEVVFPFQKQFKPFKPFKHIFIFIIIYIYI